MFHFSYYPALRDRRRDSCRFGTDWLPLEFFPNERLDSWLVKRRTPKSIWTGRHHERQNGRDRARRAESLLDEKAGEIAGKAGRSCYSRKMLTIIYKWTICRSTSSKKSCTEENASNNTNLHIIIVASCGPKKMCTKLSLLTYTVHIIYIYIHNDSTMLNDCERNVHLAKLNSLSAKLMHFVFITAQVKQQWTKTPKICFSIY